MISTVLLSINRMLVARDRTSITAMVRGRIINKALRETECQPEKEDTEVLSITSGGRWFPNNRTDNKLKVKAIRCTDKCRYIKASVSLIHICFLHI
jgi:hypothetical protein